MSADLNNAVHRLRQDCYPDDRDGHAARQADIEQLSHALGLAENTIDHLVGDLAKEVNGPTFMGEPAPPHPDDAAVDRFARAMKLKLAAARAKGRGGWSNDEPDMQQRGEGILPPRSQNQVEVLPGRYFAADPAMGDFDLYATLADARTNAQRMLDEATDEAADGGWPDDPPQICYGMVLSECVETDRKPAPAGSEFDEIVTFELAPTAQPDIARHPRPSMQFTLGQAETLLAFFGGSNGDMTVEYFPANHWPDSPEAPAGLYVYCTEYPEEGAQWLGAEDNSEEIEPTWQHIPAESAAHPEATLDSAVHAYKVASVARMAMQTDPDGTPTIEVLDASIREGVRAALQVTAPTAVPPGYVMVPIEPTEEMLVACIEAWQRRLLKKAENGTLLGGGNPRESFRENYKAMVAATVLSASTTEALHG